MMGFLTNYNDQIAADSRPDLGLDRIDALPIEGFDPQILLDPFEEQFNLPSAFVIAGNLSGIALTYIRQQDNILLVFLVNKMNATKIIRIALLGFWPG